MTSFAILSLFALAFQAALAQRGCNMIACDPRGLHTQADFVVLDTARPSIAWRTSINGLSTNRSTGCVGNMNNIVCPTQSLASRGYVSVNGSTGEIAWTDTVMVNPGLPIMNIMGDIISADGFHMEFRFQNGTVQQPIVPFYGNQLPPVSSIVYVEEPSLYHFVSYQEGLLLLYDTSGMCVASYMITKVPVHYEEVWKPINQPIVNTEITPPTSYFMAENNVTGLLRYYAMAINHEPPYFDVKWYIDIQELPSGSELGNMTSLCVGEYVYVPIGDQLYVIKDEGLVGAVLNQMSVRVSSLSSFDLPEDSRHLPRTSDDDEINREVWLIFDDVLLGVNYKNQSILHSIQLSSLINQDILQIKSNAMMFGTDSSDYVMVVAVEAVGEQSVREQLLLAVSPKPSGQAKLLWKFVVSSGDDLATIRGQIIGYGDSMLIMMSSHPISDGEIIGVKLQ